MRRSRTLWRQTAWLRMGGLAALVAVAFLLEGARDRIEARNASPFPVQRTVPYRVARALERLAPARAGADVLEVPLPVPLTLERGETLDAVARRLGLGPQETTAMVAEVSAHVDPRRLRAGQAYTVYFDERAGLAAVELELDGSGRLTLERAADGWRSSWHEFERAREVRLLRGHLDHVLEQSISAAGGDPRLAYMLADVLQWDLDFNRDLRVGDAFTLLWEAELLDGRYRAPLELLAVRYENRGRLYEAYRFGDGEAYYDGEGRPLRKMFLKSPLRFSRVTSRFSRRRFHPILRTYRPHYGVDYGAPTGTAVRVTANGTVTFAGWDGGGGRTVKVRHPNGYLTAYLHLSRFASGIRRGRRVSQGEVIGYVGATGLATAPHLDYRVQSGGRWLDPLSLKSRPAAPLAPELLPSFAAWRDALREGLDGRFASWESYRQRLVAALPAATGGVAGTAHAASGDGAAAADGARRTGR